MSKSSNEMRKAELADPEEVFLLDWGREMQKGTIPRLDEALQRVITLDTALLGGSLYVVSADVMPSSLRAAAMLAFLVSLAAAFRGSLPLAGQMRLNDPNSVREFKEKVAVHRHRWLQRACWLMWGGLALAILGFLCRLLKGS